MSEQFPDGFATNRACIACSGADDDDEFDFCRACGREASWFSARAAAAKAQEPKAESPLKRAIRLARGDPSDDVEGTISRWTDALNRKPSRPPPTEGEGTDQ